MGTAIGTKSITLRIHPPRRLYRQITMYVSEGIAYSEIGAARALTGTYPLPGLGIVGTRGTSPRAGAARRGDAYNAGLRTHGDWRNGIG